LALLVSSAARAQPTNRLRTFDAGGGAASGGNVVVRASHGGIGGIAISRWTNVVLAQGFLGQVGTVASPSNAHRIEVDLAVSLPASPNPVAMDTNLIVTARQSRNQRSADSLVREALGCGRKRADKAVRAPEKSSQDATIRGHSTTGWVKNWGPARVRNATVAGTWSAGAGFD
jgi:hypothetical protein